MTKKEVYLKYKQIQKNKAKEIHELKNEHKELQRNNKFTWQDYKKIKVLKVDFRYTHIALGLIKGLNYLQIEEKCSIDNEPNFNHVQKFKEMIIEEITNKVEEFNAIPQ